MRTLKELIPYTKIKNFTLEYANRLSRHNKVCSNYEQHALAKQWRAREISKYEDSNHLIEPNHQVVYCEMQKCASSNWRNTISMLQSINKNSPNKTAWEYTKENDRTKRDTNWKTLSLENNPERFPDNTMQEVLNNGTYFRFIFVRDPMTRLLSAYRSKIERYHDWGPQIKLRNFRIFVENIIKKTSIHATTRLNKHWRPMTDLCFTCLHDWDFIGKLETLLPDSEYVMLKAGVQGKHHAGSKSSALTDRSKLEHYFKMINQTTFLKLYQVYQKDYELFGYGVKKWLWNVLQKG